MRRLNIRINGKIETKSFIEKSDLISFIKNHNSIYFYDFKEILDVTDNIWNLNVGKSIKCWGYTFSINSKRRAGNQLTNGTIIGKVNVR